MAPRVPHQLQMRQPLAPRDINVSAQSPASSTPSKRMPCTAYDLLKNMDTPSPRGLAYAHRQLESTSHGPQNEPTKSSPLPPPANVVASIPCNASHESQGQGDGPYEFAENMSAASGAASVLRLLESSGQTVLAAQGENLLPHAWNDMLQFLASLPLPSRTDSIADTAPDAHPQTTIGLMVKPDPEHDGLGLVTGWIEGSTSDFSQEMMVGDILLAVDGTPFNHPDSLKKMRGGHVVVAAGAQMRLTLERQGFGVFDCVLVREPYASMQLKREIFELLSRLQTTLDVGQVNLYPSPFAAGEQENAATLIEYIRTKFVELEKTNVRYLHLVRSETQGLQQILEQVVLYANRAAAQGEDTIRSLTERIGKQDDDIAHLSSRLEDLPNAGGIVPGQQNVDHQSHDQVHLLRHECNRLRNSLHTKELELEGLRQSFDRKLDEEGLRDTADDKSVGDLFQTRSDGIHGANDDREHCRMGFEESDLVGLQALLDQERESNNLAQAALKRDLWVSVIRRWLNNCCRKVISSWRNEVARKQLYKVVCTKLGRSCRRRRMRSAISALIHELRECRRLRHAGVCAASGWLFLSVSKHLQAWLAYVDWKAYAQRLESKCRAKSVARIFHAWSRNYLRLPGLDGDGVTAILSSITEPKNAGAGETSKCTKELNHHVGPSEAPAPVKVTNLEKFSQTLRWESDAAIQCCFEDRAVERPAANTAQEPCRSSSQAPKQVAVATVSTGTQCDADSEASFAHRAKQTSIAGKADSFLFRGMQEKFDNERKECQRLRTSLATAQESLRRQDAMLRTAQDSDRRLKESLQMAHAQLQQSLKSAGGERHRATQLEQELEQAERKLLMSHEERDELRIIVSDERRINARSNSGGYSARANSRAAACSGRHFPPNGLGVSTGQKAIAVSNVSTRKMRLLCLNMALSKQWRRLAAIFVSWAAYVRQYSRRREGVMRITSRRFYASMRIFLGVWFALSKCVCRTRALLSVALAQRLRRVLRHILKVLKRAVFESRAARELYGLEDSMSSPRKAMQDNKPPHSITRTRLNSMAQKIKQCRRTMCTLDQSVSHVSSEVHKYEMAFRSAEAVIDELAQRIHCLYEEDAERKAVASPTKTEPLSATTRPRSTKDKTDKVKTLSPSSKSLGTSATLTAQVLQTKVAACKNVVLGRQHGQQDAIVETSACHNLRAPSYPCKPQPLDSPQPKEHHKERKYRVLGNLTESSECRSLGAKSSPQGTEAAAWRERQTISPGRVDVSSASSGPPPTPTEYSTGPGRDGNRGSPSPQPMDSPGVLSPMLRNLLV